jgi:resuscitation-promoting factor RpfA
VARKRPGLVALRRVSGWIVASLGVFVICFGVGYGSTWVSLVGGGVLLSVGAFRLVTRLRANVRQWVAGTAQVVSVSDPPLSAPFGRCELQLVVDAAGLPREIVVIREPRVAVEQWPFVGQEMPVEVAADNVRNVRIVWPDQPAEEHEEELDPMWDDDQPAPAPAAPPPSHLDRPDVDFDLDGPPTVLLGVPIAAGDMSPGDEGRLHHGVTLAHEALRRVPQARSEPRATVAPDLDPDGVLNPASGPAPRRKPSPRPRLAPPQPGPAEPPGTRSATEAGQVGPAAPPAWLDSYPSAHTGPLGAIHRVGVALQVADLERSLTFYRDKLGFHLVEQRADSVVLASGEDRLVLRALAGMEPVQWRVMHLNLEVNDVNEVYEELRAAGIRFTSPPKVVGRGHRTEQWAAGFKDPDGHGLALTEWRQVPD